MYQYQNVMTRILEERISKMSVMMTARRISVSAMADVMGVPQIAVRAIAKDSGMGQSEWIDEDSLGIFEEAYIRKLKAYFRRMMRNATEMGSSDLRTFISFCKTFKKPNVNANEICRWTDIDEDAIRRQFQAELEERYETEPCCGLSGGVNIESFASRICVKTFLQEELDETSNFDNISAVHPYTPRQVLRAVTSSLAYRTNVCSQKCTGARRRKASVFMLAAHYYIYCWEDKEDHIAC